MTKDKLNVYSLNTRGLGDKKKRRLLFKWIQSNYSKANGIVFLQETHTTELSEQIWKREWDGQMYFSHGTCGSRGVAILIPKKVNMSVNHTVSDTSGRLLLLDATVDDENFILVNVYAPTKDNQPEQISFLSDLREILSDYIDKNIVLGGDFNAFLNKDLDKKGGTNEDVSNYSKQIIDFMNEFNLVDIFRILNPETNRYTWRGHTRGGHVSSRLDYWLISTHLIYNVIDADIHPSIRSDHSLISLSFEIDDSVKRGRGFWKFNSDLLRNTDYIQLVKNLIQNLAKQYSSYEDKAFIWDFMKCELRGATISFASYLAKKRREQELYLINRLKFLEENIDSGDNLHEEYDHIKSELEGINEYKATGHLIRSKAKWVEDGEKCTKYFLQLENRNHKTKYIKSLKIDNTTIRDPQEILKAQEEFYSQLYTELDKKSQCINIDNCLFFNSKSTSLNEIDKDSCDKIITVEECTQNLFELTNNKSPGSDGFTTEFYKFFWQDIKEHVYNSFIYSFHIGKLSNNQNEAILTLLPKPNKDIRELKNWRPISLLNTDYKIITKLLANRLQMVIPNIVSEDQAGYIKDRYIGENIRTVLDVIEYTSIKSNPGFLLFLDFEKAFDTISWKFLFKTLKYFNFGNYFIKWISTLYKQPKACVLNNGYATNFFTINRGIRQGCPISALLFILVVEVLSINIKNDKRIKGISVGSKELHISQLADDTTLFVKNTQSLDRVFLLLNHFYQCAGLKLNKDKTEAMVLGNSNLNLVKYGITVTKKQVKSLGIIIQKDLTDLESINFEEKILKVKNILNMWKSRKLSIKGKITVLRSQVLPIILYPASLLYMPENTLKAIEELFFDFVWPNKKHHVKKKVLFQGIEDGGLKMPDIFSMIKAIKLMWIKRLLLKNNNFSHMAGLICKISDFHSYFTHNMSHKYLPLQSNSFYGQVLTYWEEVNEIDLSKMSLNEVLNEKLFQNKKIIIGNKPITGTRLSSKGINIMYDILKPDLSLKSNDDLGISIMDYNQLVSAIPKEWKIIIKNSKGRPVSFKPIGDNQKKIRMKYKDITSIKCRDYYWHFIDKICARPTAVATWEELYYYVNFDWKQIFSLPYETVCETSLQSMQYMILNRFFPCKATVHRWNTEEDSTCEICKCEENLEHYFFDCKAIKPFWNQFSAWWYNLTDCHIALGNLDVIFGIMNESNDNLLSVLNYCILVAKKYITSCKLQKDICVFNVFVEKMKHRLIVEEYIAGVNHKLEDFEIKWSFLINHL